jgi:hypothetical protein
MAIVLKAVPTQLPNGGVQVFLGPLCQSDADKLNRLRDGQTLVMTAIGRRNPKQHSKFFAVLKEVFDNQEQFKSEDDLREATLIEVGHCELREKLNGERYKVAKSISFGALSQQDFEPIYEACLDAWAQHFGFDMTQFEKEAFRREGIAA